MPLDQSGFSQVAINRERLLSALDAGPEGWDFASRKRCAIGIMRRMGMGEYFPAFANSLGVPEDVAIHDIFRIHGPSEPIWSHDDKTHASKVTPQMIASELREVFFRHPVE